MENIYKGFNIVQLAEMALERPNDFGWWGRDEMFKSWGWAGIDKHNGSHFIDEFNFDVHSKYLINTFPDDFEIVGLQHWAVGHVDRLTVRILIDSDKPVTEDNITDAFKTTINCLVDLDLYPIADEELYYEKVSERAFEELCKEIPKEVYIKTSIEDVASEYLRLLIEKYDFYEDSYVEEQFAINEEVLYMIGYELGLCSAEYRDFWDDFVNEQGLPFIFWGDDFGVGANIVHKLNGQLELDIEERDDNAE